MKKTMIQGWASVPPRFWSVEEIDPETRPERYKELLALGYHEKKSENNKIIVDKV